MDSKKRKNEVAHNAESSSSHHESQLSIDRIANSLNIPERDILDVFLLGSRLWGTSNAQSDFDLYIVIKDGCSYAASLHAQKGFSSIHSGNIDAIVMTETLYKERINECNVFDLVTLWISEAFVLRSAVQKQMKQGFKLNPENLWKSVNKVVTRDWSIASKHVGSSKIPKAKKIIIHMIRVLRMAIQIANTSRIDDFECATDIYETLIYAYHINSWSYFEEEIQPIRDELLETLRISLQL